MAGLIKYGPLYRPLSLLRDIQDEMNNVFQRTLGGTEVGILSADDPSSVSTSHWSPHVDIKEETNKYVILADIPGVDPKEIQISMEKGVLTIKGERNIEKKEEKENYSRMERFTGSFYRRFSLPDNADGNGIQAKSKHGVLEISIPKKETDLPKKIEVQVHEEKE